MAYLVSVKTGAASLSAELVQDGKTWTQKKTHAKEYVVIGDSISDPIEKILSTPGIPQIGSKAFGRYCKNVSVTSQAEISHPVTGQPTYQWTISCDYDGEVEQLDPTELNAEVSWEVETVQRMLWKDVVNSRPIVTACGERIIAQYPAVLPVLKIARYYPAPFDPAIITDYSNRVNSSAFWGFPAKKCFMKPITCPPAEKVETTEGNIEYFVKVSYSIVIDLDSDESEPWKLRPLHQGTRCRDVAGGPVHIWQDAETFNTGMVNLDANGIPLAFNAAPQFLSFNQYKLADFNDLGIGPDDLKGYRR